MQSTNFRSTSTTFHIPLTVYLLVTFGSAWLVWVVILTWGGPYLLCLPVWAGGLIWAAWKMDEELFRSFVSARLFVQVSATSFFYQTAP